MVKDLKSKFKYIYIAIFLITIFGYNSHQNIVRYVYIFTTFFVAFDIYLSTKKSPNRKNIWLYIIIAFILAGAIGIYIMLAFPMLSQSNVNTNIAIYYFPINIVLLRGLRLFIKDNAKYLEKNQLTLDALKIFFINFLILFSIINNVEKFDLSLFEFKRIDFIIIIMFAVIDYLLVSFALLNLASMRNGSRTKSIIFVTLFIFVYVMKDAMGLYYILDGAILPIFAKKMIMLTVMLLLGYFSYDHLDYKSNANFFRVGNNKYFNLSGKTFVHAYMFLAIFLLLIMKILSVYDFVLIGSILIIFYVLSYLVQKGIRNDAKNQALEDLVEIRTNELYERSVKDRLTGLYNRVYFISELHKMIEKHVEFYFIAIAVNRFKTINDIHGYEMGDAVLREIGSRLSVFKTENAIVSRISGDEFVLVYKNMLKSDIENVNQKVDRIFDNKIVIDGYEFKISVRKALCAFPLNGSSLSELLSFMDLSFEYNKENQNVDMFENQDISIKNIKRKKHIETLLSSPNIFNELEVFYQPQVTLKDETVMNCEALIRWNNEKEGYISPSEFIPIAEKMHIISGITEWILSEVTDKIHFWNEKYNKEITVNINVSARSFEHIRFFENFDRIIRQKKINPSCIGVEITESSALKSEEKTKEFLRRFSEMGIKISVDDFGTGYSSLSYINKFDIDELKIAKELVDDICFSETKVVVLKAISSIAKAMGIKTIAEGVETKDQLSIIKDLGFDIVQGYVYGKAVCASEFEERYLQGSAKYD